MSTRPRLLRRNDDAGILLREQTPFRNYRESLTSAAHEPGEWLDFGRLPGRYYASLRSATYVVRSYATPIAWFATVPHNVDPIPWILGEQPGEWIVPDVKYSITTTEHQSIVASALNGGWRSAPALEPIPFVPGWGGQLKVPSGGERLR